jgi:putative ABC transport system permease protein
MTAATRSPQPHARPDAATLPEPSRLNWRDILIVGSVGLKARRLRTTLSALGVSIGIAAMVGVLGISQSSKSGLLAEIGKLGNLLTVTPGQSITGQTAQLPYSAPTMVRAIGTVTQVTATGSLSGVYVYRSDKVPTVETNGINVQAGDPSLLAALGVTVGQGQFLNSANDNYPAVVLGHDAAGALGIDNLTPIPQVWLGNHWFAVVGILDPVPLAPEIDRSALIGYPAAASLLGFDGHATRLYVRTDPNQVPQTQAVLARSTYPAHPEQIQVSHPSDALTAKAAAKGALNGLFLGLAAIGLLVGGVGIANVMIISVLERRSEIGLRRAIGATSGHIRTQFLTEALLLSGLGGITGVAVGVGITAAYAALQHWSLAVPTLAIVGGLGAALGVGAIAGLYPAMRAARLTPTEALRTV